MKNVEVVGAFHVGYMKSNLRVVRQKYETLVICCAQKSNWPSVEVIDWVFEKIDHEVEAMGGLDKEARKFFPMLLAPL